MLFWSVCICSLKPQKTLCFVLFQIFRRQFHLPSGRKTIYPDIKAAAKCEHFQIQTLGKKHFWNWNLKFKQYLSEFSTTVRRYSEKSCYLSLWQEFRLQVGAILEDQQNREEREARQKICRLEIYCDSTQRLQPWLGKKTSFRIIMMSMYIYYNSWFKSRSTMSNI